ncbi:hypothetical protein PJI17_09895 [Mycobacterium kansasii]
MSAGRLVWAGNMVGKVAGQWRDRWSATCGVLADVRRRRSCVVVGAAGGFARAPARPVIHRRFRSHSGSTGLENKADSLTGDHSRVAFTRLGG